MNSQVSEGSGKRSAPSNYCRICGMSFVEHSKSYFESHLSSCAAKAIDCARRSKDPYLHWKCAVALDLMLDYDNSAVEFKTAAQFFFNLSSTETKIARALFEYSTLMDAFSNTQQARKFILESDLAKALDSLTQAAEILRATLHFAFLAPYVSGCATLEIANSLDVSDEDCLQAYKNAIALFEQSKIALSFRDENHPLADTMTAYIKFAISKALLIEAQNLRIVHSNNKAQEKENRYNEVRQEYEYFAAKAGLRPNKIDYLPLLDYLRVETSAYVVGYPDSQSLWLLNIGAHPSRIEKMGQQSPNVDLASKDSIPFPLSQLGKGRIYVTYFDNSSNIKYKEGCISLI